MLLAALLRFLGCGSQSGLACNHKCIFSTVYVAREASWPEFVDFWSSWYTEYDEDDTIRDVGFLKHLKWPSGRLTPADIDLLCEWKNGMPLSGKKKVVTRCVKAKLQDLNRLREAGPEDIFPLAAACSQSTVWRRFICYIVSPYQCPIWDRNVLRAFQLLTERPEDPEARDHEKAMMPIGLSISTSSGGSAAGLGSPGSVDSIRRSSPLDLTTSRSSAVGRRPRHRAEPTSRTSLKQRRSCFAKLGGFCPPSHG